MCRELFFRVWKTIGHHWGLTLDNYLVVINRMQYTNNTESIQGAEIVARIEDGKVVPLNKHEQDLFRNRLILSSLNMNDLVKRDYDQLAKEFDMSAIPQGEKYRNTEVIENLLM